MQEQNAQIGVAPRWHTFLQVTLNGTGGFESTAFTTLLQGPSGFWMLGGQAAEYLFDGGARRGASEQARAAWNQSVDNYRQTVLVAFEEVEDNLAALRILETEANQEAEAVAAAQHSVSPSHLLAIAVASPTILKSPPRRAPR